MNNNNIFTALLLSCLFSFIALTSSQGADGRDESLWIGLVGPMTGKHQAYGDSMAKGVELAIAELNQDSSHLPIHLTILDDQNDQHQAGERARQLVKENKVLAVLGHGFSSASINAGEVYKQHQIPAITASSTNVKVTKDNDWYFRVIFNDQLQSVFLATYTARILGAKEFSVIFDHDDYGSFLADQYSKAAKKLGIQEVFNIGFDGNDKNVNQVLDQITEQLASSKSNGALFLATHDGDGATIVKLLKDKQHTFRYILGPDGVSSSGFLNRFADLPEEQQTAGYYSNGIYAATPIIIDIANSKAFRFRNRFVAEYGHEPDWLATYYYEAGQIVGRAIRNSGLQGGLDNIKADRKRIRDYLASFNSPDNVIEGVSGLTWFDKNGDADKPIPVGIYQRGKIISAPAQLQTVGNINTIPDIEEALSQGKIVPVGDKYFYKTRIIYTGVAVNEVNNLELQKSSYDMDFYLWFRYEGEFDGAQLEFINAVYPPKMTVVKAKKIQGMNYLCYRVKGSFKTNFSFADYPFDSQNLRVKFRHAKLSRENLIFAVDGIGMEHSQAEALEPDRIIMLNSDWKINDFTFNQDIVVTESALGDLELLDSKTRLTYSLFNFSLELKRDAIPSLAKILLPLIILLMLTTAALYIPAAEIGVRASICVTALLTTVILHMKLANSLPGVSYMFACEYYFIISYLMFLISIIFTIASYIYFSSEDATVQGQVSDKEKAIRIDQVARLIYPVIFLMAFAIMTWLYI